MKKRTKYFIQAAGTELWVQITKKEVKWVEEYHQLYKATQHSDFVTRIYLTVKEED